MASVPSASPPPSLYLFPFRFVSLSSPSLPCLDSSSALALLLSLLLLPLHLCSYSPSASISPFNLDLYLSLLFFPSLFSGLILSSSLFTGLLIFSMFLFALSPSYTPSSPFSPSQFSSPPLISSSSSPTFSSPSLSISFALRSFSTYLLLSFSLSPNLLTHLFHVPFSSVKQRRIKGRTKNGGRAGEGQGGRDLSASDNENWIGQGSFYKVGIMVGQGDEE